jgi:hypothetical protein
MTDDRMHALIDLYLTKAAGAAVAGLTTFLFMAVMGAFFGWL